MFSRNIGNALALCVAAALTACGGTAAPAASPSSGLAAPEINHIKITYATLAGTEAFARVAADKGLFQKYGLTADVSYAETTTSIASLTSGEVQFSINGGPDIMPAIASGAHLKLLATLHKANPYAIVTRPDITQTDDLRGKTVAIAKLGDTSDVALRMGLKVIGLQANKDVKLLQVGGSPARLAALTSQQVQGAILDTGFRKLAEGQGLHVLFDMAQIPFAGVAVSAQESFIKANPNTTLAALQGLLDGLKYFTDEKNKPEMLAAIAKDAKLDPNDPQLTEVWDSVRARGVDAYPDKQGVQSIVDAEKDIDPGHYGSLTADAIIDPSFAAKLRAS